MAAIAAAALPFGLFMHAQAVVLPLWATGDLGTDAAGWGRFQSLRFAAATIGILILGPLSDRLGQRRVGSGSTLGCAAAVLVLALAGWHGSKPLAAVGFAALGIALSSTFVNLNALALLVSERRPARANAVYRSTLTAGRVVGPIGATALGTFIGGYTGVLLIFAGLLAASAAALRFYHPAVGDASAAGRAGVGWRAEVAGMWRTYRSGFAVRPLVAFLVLSQLWQGFAFGAGSFAAIRVATDLKLGDAAFGAISGVGGLLALAALAAVAPVADRLPVKWLYALALVPAPLALAGLASPSPWVAAGCYLAFIPLTTISTIPSGVWIKRAAAAGGISLAAGYSVFKVVQMVLASIAVALLSAVEAWRGLPGLFLAAAAASLAAGVLLLILLRVPPE